MNLPSVTVITPTGFRHKVWPIMERYMARQTYTGEIQWIVVSDDPPENPTPCTMGQTYIQGPLKWKSGFNTQRYNFAAAIPEVKGDLVLILEDDDYFAPNYIEVFVDMLKHAQLVGECDCTYYSLHNKSFKEMSNHRHASLTQTGFRRKYLPFFERAVHSGEIYMDIALWNYARDKFHKKILFSGMNLLVGMKGLPGRTGIGVGHRAVDFTPDHDYTQLKKLVGPEDAKVYIDLMKEVK